MPSTVAAMLLVRTFFPLERVSCCKRWAPTLRGEAQQPPILVERVGTTSLVGRCGKRSMVPERAADEQKYKYVTALSHACEKYE